MFGEKIMVISALLKWYVEHDLKVTQIHQVVEYKPATCFEKFGDNIVSFFGVGFHVISDIVSGYFDVFKDRGHLSKLGLQIIRDFYVYFQKR
jgi:hypothetical protein